MKKIIAFLLVLIFSVCSIAQNSEPTTQLTKADYLKKSRTQKTIGFIMLGAGTATLVTVSGGNTDLSSLGTLVVIGASSVLGSIPLFITAGKNKRKAKNATAYFRFEKTPAITNQTMNYHYSPSLVLNIHI